MSESFFLKYFQFFVELFPLEDIEEVILPEVLVGLQEKDDDLVASTLRALAILVTLLGSDVVMGNHTVICIQWQSS